MIKFAHLADCHIGGWKEERMTNIGIKAFEAAMNECIKRNVDFILISGDLFNTALPGIDYIKETARILKNARDSGISIYTIAGSHDYSVSGKTMLDVLENAGLICNVAKFDENGLKFTIDKKTNAKISGLYGKKGGLEKFEYENLNRDYLENEQGFKIFMFHSGIKEFMPQEMKDVESLDNNALPANFNYYAGGHIHYVFQKRTDNSLLMFPGALSPNNFKELEDFKNGGFYIIDEKLNHEYVSVKVKDVLSICIDSSSKMPAEITDEIIKHKDYAKDKIVLIRVEGVLKEGKPSDIDFKKIVSCFEDAYCVIKNTSKLSSQEFNAIEVKATNIADIEKSVVEENIESVSLFGEFNSKKEFVEELMNNLAVEKQDGEKSHDFEEKLVGNLERIFSIT